MTRLDSAVQRVRQLDFDNPSRNHSEEEARQLLKEHLRRTCLWKKAFGAGSWPVFTVALGIDPNLELPQELKELMVPRNIRGPLYVGITIHGYLLWSMIADTEEVRSFELPDPYEPLIQLYEGGWFFNKDKVFLEAVHSAGSVIVPSDPGYYDTSEPFAEV